MRDLVLFISFAAVMVFGYFVMKHIDEAVAANQAAVNNKPGRKSILRIALSNPSVAGALARELKRFSNRCPETEIAVYTGCPDICSSMLREGKADMAFLPCEMPEADTVNLAGEYISLSQNYLRSDNDDLTLFPLGDELITQCVVWKAGSGSTCAESLAEQLEKSFPARGRSNADLMV